MKLLFVLLNIAVLLSLTSPLLRAADNVQISEFMALNSNGIEDEDNDNEDWIEIHNAGTNIVNLAGWYLTDTTNKFTNWMFPSITLAPDAYLIVFASGKDRNVGELHTNFKLSGNGEYLGLIRPDGVTVAWEYYPTFPIQAPDISYGLRGSTFQDVLLAPGALARALVPTNAALEDPPSSQRSRPWTLDGLDDSGWQAGTTGVGYEAATGYEALLGLNVVGMQNSNETVYIRIPFEVNDPSTITALTLRMRYDDGFIAYVNGHLVAWDNSSGDPSVATWTNGAPANRDDSIAVVPRDFNITAYKGFLHTGTNLLAIQGLNNLPGSSDLLILPEILATVMGSSSVALRYFPIPTPGAPNNSGINELGPIIEEEDHHPAVPTDNDSITVTAFIHPARGTVTAAALHYRTNFGAEVTIPFTDNGTNGDAGVGDGIYGAIIPADAHNPGQMVRWYITATDSFGGNSRFPSFVEPLSSPEYSGTIVADQSLLTNPLPVLYWFIQNPAAAETGGGTRASLFYEGVFYDNILMNIHGQSSQGFPKKSFDVDFHPGHNFKYDGPGMTSVGTHSPSGEGRVGTATPRADDINLLTTYPDKAQMRNVLSYETYRDADMAYHWVIPVRVQQNGAFWATAHLVENGDEDWLIRMGFNSQGALYKMYNVFSSAGDATSGAEKKTRKNESNADLSAFFAGAVAQTGEARRRYIYDNVDIPEVIDYLAARIITGDVDCCHKNYYFYRDTGVSDEWQMFAWDVDLSFGRVWTGAQTYWQQTLITNTTLYIGNNNGFALAIFNTPEMKQMYLRRIRTLMDELIKAPGTPIEALHYEPRIDDLAELLAPDAALDAAKWGSDSWGNGSTAPCCKQTLPQAVAEMKNFYMPGRRLALFNKIASASATELPDAQPPGTVINFGAIEPNPSSANQDQEYIQLLNPGGIAVDISGWTLSGAVNFRFKGGTVIPAGGNLYVAANRKAFRNRATPPTTNLSVFVVGDYSGRLSARGEALQLADRQGVIIANANTPANPSLPQSSLRITEIMYHPPILPGDTFDNEEYEYIELKNIGMSQINLANVHLSEGIVFNFTGSLITTLGAGERVLVVKNTNAFTLRYGAGAAARIAGVYTGNLDNSGERIRLDDASNEKILDFSYNNSWYPITDGRGFSLVISNATAPFYTWDLKESWRPSGHEYGTPGQDDSPLPPVAAILVNEVLSHTDLPQKDAIELYNPTGGAVDIGGWYITDDPSIPKKYRIAALTMIPAFGYITFNEDHFNTNPGVPPSFSFSSTGDEAYLFSGNSLGELTGYHQGYKFEASATGVPFGRYIDSQTVEHFVAMAALSTNAVNPAPKVGPVVISEINYHPPQKLEGIDFVEASEDEYIELRNITGAVVPLYDPSNPINTWQIRGGVDFDFPLNRSIPANGQLLVVSFNPNNDAVSAAAFRARHGLAVDVLLAGPFSGKLDNDGNNIRLRRPDAPEGQAVPYIVVDEVDYKDHAPWPVGADGFGPSLQRVSLTGFGNDPTNWVAATITPAAPYGGGAPPVITLQPTNQNVVAGSNATFSVTATGSSLRYQWIFNGDSLIGQTNSTLTLQNVKANQQGPYEVLVLNAAGSVESSNAVLTVQIPARITQQPANTVAHLGATAIFVVQASSSTPLSYQWRKDGNVLSGKTSSFLTITNVMQSDQGFYDVIVTDGVGSVPSGMAQLTVLLYPDITGQPINQTVTVLASPVNVTFSVAANSGTPLRYQWYFNGAPAVTSTNIASVTNASLVINGVQPNHSGDYFVVVTDNFSSTQSVTAKLTVNTAARYSQAPNAQAVPERGTVSFSSAWSGTGPFLHRWRRTSPLPSTTLGFLGPTNGLGRLMISNGYITASSTNSVLVLTNVGTNLVGNYDIVVSNAVGQIASTAAALTVLADTDHDGLPDSWETNRMNFSTNDASDALRDDDGDGMNNAAEYFAGTDYLNPTNYLRSAIQTSGNVQIMFQAVSNRTYTVQYNETLNPTQWVNLIIETGRTNTRNVTITDPTPRPQRFYRIVTPAQP